jgi:hypothetical protein
MKIKLDKYYQNVNGVRLQPGIHDLDPTLAAHLVDNGHAEYIDTPVTTPYPDSEAIIADLEAEGQTIAPDDRDAIIQTLDNAGIEYSKYWSTDKLLDALNNA